MPHAPDYLWRIVYLGNFRHTASHTYFWDNARRQPEDQVTLQVVDSGSLTIRRCDGISQTVWPGQVVLFRHGEASSYGRTPGDLTTLVTRWISFRGPGLSAHWDGLRADGGWVLPLTPDLDGHLRHLVELGLQPDKHPPTDVASAIHALVMCLASATAVAVRTPGSVVEQAIDEVLASPCSPWSVTRIAHAHGISREHFTRAFVARVGQPPSVWLTHQRLAIAKDLLAGSNLTVAQIACQCGIGSPHTLARQLKAAWGATPTELRRGQHHILNR